MLALLDRWGVKITTQCTDWARDVVDLNLSFDADIRRTVGVIQEA